MAIGRPGKKIMCVNDGRVFTSITQAAKHYQMARSTISKQLTGIRSQAAGLYFMYVDDVLSAEQAEAERKHILEQVYNIKNI